MSATGAVRPTSGSIDERSDDRSIRRAPRARRLVPETKASFKTTEFFAFLVVLAGILVSAALVDESNAGGFGARQAWPTTWISGSLPMIAPSRIRVVSESSAISTRIIVFVQRW